MDCRMLGGAYIGERCLRHAVLRPISGYLEQAILEALERPLPWPTVVTSVLGAAVARLDDLAASDELLDDLTVADRQYLLVVLGIALCGDQFWQSFVCTGCGRTFDVSIRRSELPVKLAGAGFPFTEVECAGHKLRLRAPRGCDQTGLWNLSNQSAIGCLAQRCIVELDGQAPEGDCMHLFDERALDSIEDALEQISPEVGTTATCSCPECQTEQVVEVDPFRLLDLQIRGLYGEIHSLASRYHWSEAELLSLPRERRHRYLRLIEQERGLCQ